MQNEMTAPTKHRRLDLDGVQFPPSNLKHFPRLDEVQISSTLDFPELDRLPITKLTVIQRVQTTDSLLTNRHTIRNLPALTHLQIVSHGVFGTEIPLLDFDSLPALKFLRLSQHYHGYAFTHQGSPGRLRVLSLLCVKISASFLSLCHKLSHLHIVSSMNCTYPTSLPSLKILEIYNSPSGAILASDLPNLRFYYEYQSLPYLMKTAQDSLRPLSRLKLSVALLQYPPFIRDDDNIRYTTLLTELDKLYAQGAIKKGYLWTYMQSEDETRPWGEVYNDRSVTFDNMMEQLVKIDSAQSFLQTRMYHQSRAEAQQRRRRNPMDDIFEYSVEREYRWERDIPTSHRRSNMDLLRLLG